jgi:transposase
MASHRQFSQRRFDHAGTTARKHDLLVSRQDISAVKMMRNHLYAESAFLQGYVVVRRARDLEIRTSCGNRWNGHREITQKLKDAIPVEVREALLPLVQLVETVNDCIALYDQKIEELGREKYGHTTLLRQVKGVGPITSLAYVLTLEDPQRFASSRDGCW